jgi:class 3 adenylate cyclase/tetratricopeptide (TPR) repeat protein
MSQRVDLDQAIAALEARRVVLGDAVVDAAVAALRQAAGAAGCPAPQSREQRKQATVLFADVSGFTAMAEAMDPEHVRDTIDALWQCLDGVIAAHGGTIDKHIGDAVMALWGVGQVREDDAERAVRAALAMQATVSTFRPQAYALQIRIGIHTGPVLLGEVGTTHEFTAMGGTVNLASRLEHAAPIGGILISHDTARLVRGLFDVVPEEPLVLKGKREPVQAYRVERARPRAFRMRTRGVEGVETPMVGRQVELQALQSAFATAVEGGEAHLVTIVGDAGVGKSRLLDEFEGWVDLLPEPVLAFHGRATPEMTSVPYGIVRDVFRDRFDILESDSAAAVRARFEAGMAPYLAPDRAHLVGHLVGFDFSATTAVQNLLASPAFGMLALANLLSYFRGVTAHQRTVLFFEDIHWADSASLDLIARLVGELAGRRLLIVCLARPALLERRPAWGHGSHLARLDLHPLAPADGRSLVAEILHKVDDLSAELAELIVTSAEGNPFYVEELIKMLIEDGVILPAPTRWRVDLGRLRQVRVPPTLTGVLQARLDGLPAGEKEVLQRAAVVGRLFWDAAVAELRITDEPAPAVGASLEAVQRRELIFRHERSAFAGTQEYAFKHALLHDVTYETVLLRLRRRFHRQAAAWLEAHAGERIGEYLSPIARHYELAGEAAQASAYLRRVGEAAFQTSAFSEAADALQRALALLPEADWAGRVETLAWLGETYTQQGECTTAEAHLREALALARQHGAPGPIANVLSRLSWTALNQGAFGQARDLVEEALSLARQAGDRRACALALRRLGSVTFFQADYATSLQCSEESLALYQEMGDREGCARSLINLGNATWPLGDYAAATKHYEGSLALFQEMGDREGLSSCLNNLGNLARVQGDDTAAIRYAEECLAICREIGSLSGVAIALDNLGCLHTDQGQRDLARRSFQEALQQAQASGAWWVALDVLVGLARLQVQAGDPVRAAELLGLTQNHPATSGETVTAGVAVLQQLQATLPADELEKALARGRALDLAAVVDELLA